MGQFSDHYGEHYDLVPIVPVSPVGAGGGYLKRNYVIGIHSDKFNEVVLHVEARTRRQAEIILNNMESELSTKPMKLIFTPRKRISRKSWLGTNVRISKELSTKIDRIVEANYSKGIDIIDMRKTFMDSVVEILDVPINTVKSVVKLTRGVKTKKTKNSEILDTKKLIDIIEKIDIVEKLNE